MRSVHERAMVEAGGLEHPTIYFTFKIELSIQSSLTCCCEVLLDEGKMNENVEYFAHFKYH